MADEITKVQLFLDDYPDVFTIFKDRNRILCKLTKHELPISLNAVKSYVDGKKFKRFYSKVKCPSKVYKIEGEYKDYFAPGRESKNRLYCKLTKKEINNLPHEIEQHVTGYRFLKAKFKRQEAGDNNNTFEEQENEEEDILTDENEDSTEELQDFAKSSDEEHSESDEIIDRNKPFPIIQQKVNSVDTVLTNKFSHTENKIHKRKKCTTDNENNSQVKRPRE